MLAEHANDKQYMFMCIVCHIHYFYYTSQKINETEVAMMVVSSQVSLENQTNNQTKNIEYHLKSKSM